MKLEKSKGSVYKKPETNDLMSVPPAETSPVENLAQLDQTILSKLLRMLRHPVIFDNRSLLDKMLHLLGNLTLLDIRKEHIKHTYKKGPSKVITEFMPDMFVD